MSKYMDRAKELRAADAKDGHYNCAQSVLLPFAEEAGLSEKEAYRIAANFGGGMKMAATCGAVTGGIMVLGLFGIDDRARVGKYYRMMKENHEGFTNCADLLRLNKECGRETKEHCDEMVFESVAVVEELLRENGMLSE